MNIFYPYKAPEILSTRNYLRKNEKIVLIHHISISKVFPLSIQYENFPIPLHFKQNP